MAGKCNLTAETRRTQRSQTEEILFKLHEFRLLHCKVAEPQLKTRKDKPLNTRNTRKAGRKIDGRKMKARNSRKNASRGGREGRKDYFPRGRGMAGKLVAGR